MCILSQLPGKYKFLNESASFSCLNDIKPEAKMSLTKVLHSCVNVMLPAHCASCGKYPASYPLPICRECSSLILSAPTPSPKTSKNLEKILSCRAYEGPLKECLKNFKYGGNRRSLDIFRVLLLDFLDKERSSFNGTDGIIPVPLHPAKRRVRGYNQSELIAEMLASEISSPVFYHSLIKIKNNAPQTGLPKNKRFKNPGGSFAVVDRLRIAGKTLLLVDDIVTTGATLEACARELLRAGARSITGFTLAETD
jgi:ComF family protein